MFRTTAQFTVTVRRPNPESGELESVDVIVKKGNHDKGKSPEWDEALEQLWSAGLAADDDRPTDVVVTDVVTGAEVVIENPITATDPAQEG